MSEELNQEVMIDIPALEVGQTVTGTVTKVEDKHVVVDVGYKMDGVIPLKEVSNFHIEKPSDVLHEGQELTLKVIKIEEDDLVLSKRAVDAEVAWDKLAKQLENAEVFTVTVKDIVKGGVVADVGVRGFIPASQLEDNFVEDYSGYVGSDLEVKVLELNREQNRIVLSHRAVLEDEKRQRKEHALKDLRVGDVLEGKVERLTSFGAFVNLGEVDGLLHISQISYDRVDNVESVLSVGQEVKVQVIGVDLENEKISLSMKSISPSPWSLVAEQLKVGQVIEGTVKKMVSYGVFVEVLPHVEGLVHISQLSDKHVKNANEVVSVGDVVTVKVMAIDLDAKKLSLSVKEAVEKEPEEDYSNYVKNEDNFGYQLGELFADQLKKFEK